MSDVDPEPPRVEPRVVMLAGSAVYLTVIIIALIWLHCRDRLDMLAALAIGERGVFWASGIGLLVGLSAAGATALLGRRWRELQEFEQLTRATFGGTGANSTFVLVLLGALAEELLFRLAVQDQFGLAGSVAVSVGLYSCVGNLRFLPYVGCQALALGALVHQGFGLLSSTTAHAIMNYLVVRRIQCT